MILFIYFYDQGASQKAGPAAALAETRKCRAFEGFVNGAGYQFVLLVMESE